MVDITFKIMYNNLGTLCRQISRISEEIMDFNLNLGLISFIFQKTEWVDAPMWAVIPAMALVIIAAYLLGSINSAIIISKLLYKEDIRTKGSGNAGMTNMHRNYGLGAAGLTLLGDLMKTVIAIAIAGLLFGFRYVGGVSVSDFCYIAGLCAVLGHIFPIFYGFKGGKGVLATATMALVLTPIEFAILILVFIVMVAFSRFVSLGSVSAAGLYPVALSAHFSIAFNDIAMSPIMAISVIALAVIIVWCHRANLKRIGEGTENKLSFGKKKEEPIEDDDAESGDEE